MSVFRYPTLKWVRNAPQCNFAKISPEISKNERSVKKTKILAKTVISTKELFNLRDEIEKISKKIDFLISCAEVENANGAKRRAPSMPEDCAATR